MMKRNRLSGRKICNNNTILTGTLEETRISYGMNSRLSMRSPKSLLLRNNYSSSENHSSLSSSRKQDRLIQAANQARSTIQIKRTMNSMQSTKEELKLDHKLLLSNLLTKSDKRLYFQMEIYYKLINSNSMTEGKRKNGHKTPQPQY